MKHSYLLTIALLAVLLSACHSNEANYKAAYDKAREKKTEVIDDEFAALIKAEKRRDLEVVNGDTVRVVRAYTNVTDGQQSDALRYNVVVGQFKQLFNARTYRDRLKSEGGYPSVLLYGTVERDKKYFVVIKSFSELDVAAAFLKNLGRQSTVKILEPEPWILERL
ncbi:MAG: SPOR domain-containing protein [Muribaculaceae bacterium]|nr:SPOR domain-containing protein [Muribaculaceae bacterium]